jgi:4-amino-4-deoxy-L-arabinose transferase-like glycosyltransferase
MKWPEPRPALAASLLTLVTLACLLPFLGKAFHMDDPLFIWTAKHIQSHPLDFYGFNVNWSFRERPMVEQTQNPPLAAYCLALVATVLGWSERALHFGFLFPAIALVLGTWRLAIRLCAHPFVAALAIIAMPVFLLSSTSVMCDTLMSALWVWAMCFWIDGLDSKRPARLWLAAALIAACALTKYFGAALIPLLAVYSLLQKPGSAYWLKYFILPIVILALYQWWTARHYGHGLIFGAGQYLATQRVETGILSRLLETLAFCGGCILIALPATPLLFGKKGILAGTLAAIAAALLIMALKKVGKFPLLESGHFKWSFLLQMTLWIAGGLAVVSVALSDFLRRRTPDSILLCLWLFGTLLFAGAINWTVAGRNFLPLAPAVAILIVRQMEFRAEIARPAPFRFWWLPFGSSLAVALFIARADWQFANSARTAASSLHNELAPRYKSIAFEGHWGFHYYMQQLGGRPLAQTPLVLNPNEAVIVPMQNTCIFDLPSNVVEPLAEVNVPASKALSLQSEVAGAGYYSDEWGPAPFVFGPAELQSYWVFHTR